MNALRAGETKWPMNRHDGSRVRLGNRRPSWMTLGHRLQRPPQVDDRIVDTAGGSWCK